MTYFESLKDAKGITDVFMERKDKYLPALVLAQEFLREESYLLAKDRELIAAYTSKLNGCKYCCSSHVTFAVSCGITEDEITLVVTNENVSEHPLGPILAYVRKLTLDPSSLTQEDADAVLNDGFTENELKDAIAVCALFNFYNRIVEGHGIEQGTAEDHKDSADIINEIGYDGRYFSK